MRAPASVDVASLTTPSLPALKAFLEGERHVRAANYDEAISSYKTAASRDSTFALAYARLGLSYGWLYDLVEANRYWQRAYEFSDRLPTRERKLVHARQLRGDQPRAAADTLRRMAAAYPDDPRIWYQLSETILHGYLPRGPVASEQAFHKAIMLDPAHAPYHHYYVDLAFYFHRDSALAAKRIAGHPTGERSEMYRTAMDMVFGTSRRRGAAMNGLDSLLGDRRTFPADVALFHPKDVRLWEEVIRRMILREESDQEIPASFLPFALYRQGRLREGLEASGNLESVSTKCNLVIARSMGVPVSYSLLRSAFESEKHENLTSEEEGCRILYQIEQGRESQWKTAIRQIEERREGAGETADLLPESQIDLLRAYAAWKAGDVEKAADMFADAEGSTMWTSIWRGDVNRELGQLHEAEGWYLGAWWLPIAHKHLGHLYEEMGEPQKAAHAFERFIAAYKDADPRLQPLVDEARARLRAIDLRRAREAADSEMPRATPSDNPSG